jgi:hypothetical protein
MQLKTLENACAMTILVANGYHHLVSRHTYIPSTLSSPYPIMSQADLSTCCTCATLLTPPSYTTTSAVPSLLTEKPPLPSPSPTPLPSRSLPCCPRQICQNCIDSNPRFATYCPFCQVSSEPSSLPAGGLKLPPAYTEEEKDRKSKRDSNELSEKRTPLDDEAPPAYAAAGTVQASSTREQQEDTIHHLHASDTLPALSLAYKVPAPVLRTHNNLFSDSLLAARRTLNIPRSHYSGPSLSAHPVEDPEEVERKRKLRAFMVGAKCHEYDVAELYLGQAQGDVGKALDRWREDERWERENPLNKGKGVRRTEMRMYGGGGIVGQLRS